MLRLGLLFQSLYKQNDHMMELWEEAEKKHLQFPVTDLATSYSPAAIPGCTAQSSLGLKL